MDDIGSKAEPTSSLVWADVILADFQRVISRYMQNISTYLSCNAKIQAKICMFTKQNRRGLNRLILRPLWLMTLATADVISVPSVHKVMASWSSGNKSLPKPILTQTCCHHKVTPGHDELIQQFCLLGRNPTCCCWKILLSSCPDLALHLCGVHDSCSDYAP